jgi:hypothetical protein
MLPERIFKAFFGVGSKTRDWEVLHTGGGTSDD